MEKGALATNNEEFINSWRFAAKYWKTGKNTIANKQISSLIRKNPEVIGDTIFSIGNVTQIKEARKALRYAAAYSKGTDDAFEFSQAWKQMQSGYLRGVLAKAKDASKVKLTEVPAGLQESLGVKTKEVSAGELSIAKLKSLFIEGTPQNRTMLNAFTDQQRSALKTFINTVEKAQKRPQAAGEFMVTVGQAGLVLNTFGAFGPATMEATEFSGDLALYTIGPYILSKLLVNPRYARLISKGINAKPTSPQAGAIVAKIIAAATNIDALGE
jgi:rRNA processing protein Krr1/Pno1